MITFVLAFGFMLLIVLAMAVGPMFGRPAIKGSCGGLSATGSCTICGGDPARCDGNQDAQPPTVATRDAFYDASRKG